jgi:hypothetical protein
VKLLHAFLPTRSSTILSCEFFIPHAGCMSRLSHTFFV